jgi:hypothetical protein
MDRQENGRFSCDSARPAASTQKPPGNPLRKCSQACTARSIFPDGCMASSFTSTMTGISKPGSKRTLEPAHETVLALSVDPFHLYKHLAFGRCVSANVRRDL